VTEWELPANEVHCWTFIPGRFPVEEMTALLCPEERTRAARFKFDGDRIEYVVCRGVLRSLLARYLDGEARGLRFAYSAKGKPRLAVERNRTGLEFSVTHSHGAAVIAVTWGHPVGVDVERVRPLADLPAMVQTCFAVEEQEEFWSLPKSVQLRAFLTGWTRKEAVLKATGEGLRRPLSSFAVTITPDKPPRLLRLDSDTNVGREWTTADLAGNGETVAAIAVPCPDSQVRVRELWPESTSSNDHLVVRDATNEAAACSEITDPVRSRSFAQR
jgi:4'-phosphopantetheinyl transferase